MADSDHDGAADTDELLCADVNDNMFGLDHQPLRRDHCDLLLDAIDAQLGHLQVQSEKQLDVFRKQDSSVAAHLQRNQSQSKDTGLGSTNQTNDTPMSCFDLIQTRVMEQTLEGQEFLLHKDSTPLHRSTPERSTGPGTQDNTEESLNRRRRNKQAMESRREEVIWRLERLLGDTCTEEAVAEEALPPSDSICTEDFVCRFREEMVEVEMPEINDEQPDKEEEAEKTEIYYSDICQSEQTGQRVVAIERQGSATPGKSRKGAETVPAFRSNQPGQQKELENPLWDNVGLNVSHISEKPPDSLDYNRTSVPVKSFDTVSIASDLDSVCTEQVRQHIHARPGWHSLIQSVTSMDDYLTNQSDDDTPTQEESEHQCGSVHRSSLGNVQKSPVQKPHHQKRRTYRHGCASGDDDTDEEMNHWSEKCRSERTSEKMQRAKTKECLADLRQKREKEERTLRLKVHQLKDVEFCLSELQQRRRHALQGLERLTAETAEMVKEKQNIESILSSSRAERDSLSCQLETLQRQRESCLCEIRDMEEELASLSQRKKSLKFGNGTETSSVLMSVLEREEMERQLDAAKTTLFAEQRRAREELESMQENLEQTREELQRATEAESSLRNRCARLEEKQIQKTEQIEALGAQVRELHFELGECRVRVTTLENMLAQKEQQLHNSQEKCGALQAERNELKGALQHLKTQHCKALKEAREQVQTVMLREEAVKLRMSLEQQREEAKIREEELRRQASEKVCKALEEERRKWEAEKVEAVQVHCGILEEKHRKILQTVRSEMQQEKSKAAALQHKVSKLRTRLQELESESCAQQTERESLLAVICRSLKEEHQAELQNLKQQMSEQSQRTVLRLEQAAHLAEGEADRLRLVLEEMESSSKQVTSELGAECQHLHLLVEQSGAKQNTHLPASPTVSEALATLRALRGQLELAMNHLHQELDSEKHISVQLRKEKERELNIQKQQLRLERDRALDSITERLIQEHIEELSSLSRAHAQAAEGGGAAASLRKQLEAKELQLRQVQSDMGQWKEQTAARLACKFEDVLTAELERCKAKLLRGRETRSRGGEQKKSLGPDGELMPDEKETPASVCSPSLHAVDSTASHMASFKLLRHLQSRVKQLRLENQAYACSQFPPDADPLNLTGSYFPTNQVCK